MPREQTKNIEKPLSYGTDKRPVTRIRLFLGRIPGEGLTRFRVQLEYRIGDTWVQVAGSDHNPDAEAGHDVTNEGVHLDVYRDGDRVGQESIFPVTDPATGLKRAETYILDNEQRLTERFEQWHDLHPDRTRNNNP